MKATIDQSKTWYVATYRSKPFVKAIECATAAMTAIRKAGFDVYLPRGKEQKWSRRGHTYLVEEFPAMAPYLFVGFAPRDEQFGIVRDMDEVGGFLGVGGKPIPVPSEVVLAILIAETEMLFDDTPQAKRKREGELDDAFPVGQAVKLVSDLNALLAGLDGTVLGTNHRDRVHVAFGAIKSWVARSDIKAA